MPKEIIKVIIDEETGKKIKVTSEMIIALNEAIVHYRENARKFDEGARGVIISVGEMIDKKLYLASYTNFKAFADEVLQMSVRHAYKLYEVYKKVPLRILSRGTHLKTPSYRRLYALPGGESFWGDLSEADIKELATISDEEFSFAEKAANKEVQGWKTRYQKQYRNNQEKDQKIKTFKAEKEALLNDINKLNKALSLAKTEEDNEKILRLQQELDNWKKQYQALDEKVREHKAQELSEQQALAVCNKSFDAVLTAMLDLKRVNLCPAIIPQVYGLYTLIRDMVDAEITYITSKTDITDGPLTLRDFAKEVNRIEKGQSVEEFEEQEKQKRRGKIEKDGCLDSRTEHLDD